MSDLPTRPAAALPDPWADLRRFTQARIALGSVGSSLPTSSVLEFSMAHARARDAVHLPLEVDRLASSFEAAFFSVLRVSSQATNREEYLARPDFGRTLHPASRDSLLSPLPAPSRRLTIVVADGLSSLAPTRHALPLALQLRTQLSAWHLDSIIIATQARVALGDDIGRLRNAEAVVMLIGERPGLSSTDSLGAYLTYAPHPGRSDAERNCISNIHHEGLSYTDAAHKIHQLLNAARLAGASGIAIKDRSMEATPSRHLL